MDTQELQKLAEDTRMRRETGIALLVSSCLLGLFLFIPLAPRASTDVPGESQRAAAIFPDVVIEAESALVLDLVTGKTLYEKNADAQLPLASITKLLTVYAATELLVPDTEITISPEATRVEFPRAFNVGQTFLFSDLARLTLTASLNDGAAAIIEAAARQSGRRETELLASAATALDLSSTFALNGSGLDVTTAVSGGYGSARDVARLSGALLERAPKIAAATTEPYAEAVSLGKTAYRVKNTDPIIPAIPGLLLSKTGYTDLAKGNLALVFDSGIGHPIAVVVLGSSQGARFTDGLALVEATLSYFASSTL